MAASESFATWITVIDHVMPTLPDTAATAQHLRDVRADMVRYIEQKQGKPKAIEGRLLALASDHADLFAAAAAQIMAEIFQLIDPEIERCRAAKHANRLSDKDKATLRGYLTTLEECDRLLGGMRGK